MEQDATWKGIILVAAVACAVYWFTDVVQPPKTPAKSESPNCGEADPEPDKRDDASNCEPELDCREPDCSEPNASDATPNCESDEWLEVSDIEIPGVEVLEINAPDAPIKN